MTLMSPDQGVVKGEMHFEHALAVAGEQQAKSWELRAAMSMARRESARRAPAGARLSRSLYGWFTDGFDTLDVKAAKALLNELGSGARDWPATSMPSPRCRVRANRARQRRRNRGERIGRLKRGSRRVA
jgi:hypothetical protein